MKISGKLIFTPRFGKSSLSFSLPTDKSTVEKMLNHTNIWNGLGCKIYEEKFSAGDQNIGGSIDTAGKVNFRLLNKDGNHTDPIGGFIIADVNKRKALSDEVYAKLSSFKGIKYDGIDLKLFEMNNLG